MRRSKRKEKQRCKQGLLCDAECEDASGGILEVSDMFVVVEGGRKIILTVGVLSCAKMFTVIMNTSFTLS